MTGIVLLQVAGMAPQAVLDRMQSMAPIRPTESMVQQALSGGTGGHISGACSVQACGPGNGLSLLLNKNTCSVPRMLS